MSDYYFLYSSAVLQYGFLMVRGLIEPCIKKNRKHLFRKPNACFIFLRDLLKLILAKVVSTVIQYYGVMPEENEVIVKVVKVTLSGI